MDGAGHLRHVNPVAGAAGAGVSGGRTATIVPVTTTAPRLLQVRRCARVTPGMIRVTLAGEELTGFAGDGPDRRIKMFFPVPGQDRPAVPRASTGGPVWPAGEARPTIRTYTVRRFDASAGELDVDFVLHAGHGPAAAWAKDARPGAWVGVSEPGRALRAGPDRRLLRRDRRRDRPARGGHRARRDRPRSGVDVPRGRRRRRGAGPARRRHVGAPGRSPGGRAARRGRARRRACPTAAGRRGSPASRRACGTCASHLLDERGFDRRLVYATGYWRDR